MNDSDLRTYRQRYAPVARHWQQLTAPPLPVPRQAGQHWSPRLRHAWLLLPLLVFWLWPRQAEVPVQREHFSLSFRSPALKVQVRLPGRQPALPTGRLPPLSPPRPQRKPRVADKVRLG